MTYDPQKMKVLHPKNMGDDPKNGDFTAQMKETEGFPYGFGWKITNVGRMVLELGAWGGLELSGRSLGTWAFQGFEETIFS